MKLNHLAGGGQRAAYIDVMRFVGLSLIILAHVAPPETLLHLRSFDVPMMLFVSGLAYAGKSPTYSIGFLTRRFLRLVVPVYLFLTFYFLAAAALYATLGIDFGIRAHHVIGSYLLMDGIGYVWVIRVFLIVSLLTPFLLAINRKVTSHTLLAILLLAAVAATTCAIRANFLTQSILVREFLYYAIGYGAMFLLGVRAATATPSARAILAIVILIALVTTAFAHNLDTFVCFNNFKYPPQLSFLLYGALMSLLTMFIAKAATPQSISDSTQSPTIPPTQSPRSRAFTLANPLTLFIGANTIWIYLWHIPLIQLTGRLSLHFLLRYIIVYTLATLICYLQCRITDRLAITHPSPLLKYLKG